nr:MAG TPA: hypothetical protein [Caudoviricetes sp.]
MYIFIVAGNSHRYSNKINIRKSAAKLLLKKNVHRA